MTRRDIARICTVILLTGYLGLLFAMGIAPERMGQPALAGSHWSLLLVAATACYFGQIVLVVLYALLPGRDADA